MTPEGRVKDAIKKLLVSRGAYYFMPVSNGMGRHGIPDIIACYRGWFIGIEVKAPGKEKTVTANQARELENIGAAGGHSVVASDPNFVQDVFDVIDLKHATSSVKDYTAGMDTS